LLAVLLAAVIVALGAGRALAVSAGAGASATSTGGTAANLDSHWGLMSASADAQANPPGIHAHGHGYAHVGLFSITKSAYAHVQFSDDAAPKGGWAYGTAGTGSFIIHAPPGYVGSAQVRARLLKTGSPLEEEETADNPPEVGTVPAPGMYADSFFDVFTDVNVRIVPPGSATPVTLMDGKIHLGGPQSSLPGLTPTPDGYGYLNGYGSLNGYGLLEEYGYLNGTEERNAVRILDDFVTAPFDIPVGQQFDSFFDVFTEIRESPTYVTADGDYAVGGLFKVELELVDQSGMFTLEAVPEPATLSLLALGGLALLRRRR
jgi:hypothetical protein